MENTTPMIEVADLHKAFGTHQVLSGVNLKVRRGESMVVIGGSGTGKSVLIKCIIGLLPSDRGSIIVDGEEITRLKESKMMAVRRKFGMLFQGGALFDSMNVWENVTFGLRRIRKITDEEARAAATEKLQWVGLKNIEDLKPAELSGGMKKRVSLARALAMEPEILLYDEPTTGLDPIMSDVINELIVKLRTQLKVTSITITHDMKSANKIADRIAMLYQGEIIGIGTPREIAESENPIIQQFIEGRAEGPIQI